MLKSQECDELTRQINELLSELQDSVFHGESIRILADTLATYISTVKYASGRVSKRGGIGEVLKGGGAGFEKYPVLERYKPFYSSTADKVTKWAIWRTSGIDQMNGNSCPFCATDLEKETIEAENNTIKTVFRKSALDAAGAILKFLSDCIEKGYIKFDTVVLLAKEMNISLDALIFPEVSALNAVPKSLFWNRNNYYYPSRILVRKPADKVNYAQTISKYLFALLLFGSNGLAVSFIDLAVCKLFC